MEITPVTERTPPGYEPGSQPRLVDYVFLLAGIGVSVLLADLIGLKLRLADGSPGPTWQALLNVLPTMLFLPVGVILFWPVFSLSQWLTGRSQGLTAGEWLIGLAWLAALAFGGWGVCKGTRNLPDFLPEDGFKEYVVLGYILFMVSMGTLAAAIWLIGLVGRWSQPWTHTLGLALMIWPALPLLVIWLANIKME